MTICIIPARGNSKRITNKNIIKFINKPIIFYAIRAAIKSKLFKRIIVSTDSKKIAKIAEYYGAEVPFLRSKKLSDDFSTSKEVVIDAIKKIFSENEKYHCCIYPTSILLNPNDLARSLKKMKKINADQLIPITDFEYPPQRSLTKVGKNWIKFTKNSYLNSRSQDIPTIYHDIGSFYFYRTSSLLKKGKILPKKTTYFYINRLKTLDINYPIDLKIAKIKFKLLKKNG